MAILPISGPPTQDNARRGEHFDRKQEVADRQIEDELKGLQYHAVMAERKEERRNEPSSRAHLSSPLRIE
jgi:hypothetical protein